jgi:UDP-N-acetylglucosamine 1-carboxyvinyltransferase
MSSGSKMSYAAVSGGHRLVGEPIPISGFKHSLVTLFAAALIMRRPVVIHNCPDILETHVLSDLVRSAGGIAVYRENILQLDATHIKTPMLNLEDMDKIHGSSYLVPAFLAQFGTAQLTRGLGGCQIGNTEDGHRPWKHYLEVLSRFGATVSSGADGTVEVHETSLRACEIDLLDFTNDQRTATGPHYSGASKMAVLTAAIADGTSILRNLYPKPDVTDLLDFFESAGFAIGRQGPNVVTVTGGHRQASSALHVTLSDDLIEVVTYAVVAALHCDEPLELSVQHPQRCINALAPEVAALRRLGVRLEITHSQSIIASRLRKPSIGNFTSESCGIYSDSLPFLLLLSMFTQGESTFSDTVWPNRFQYLAGLTALGGSFQYHAEKWTVQGPCPPKIPGTIIQANDLRGAAVLVLAALSVPGSTIVRSTHHLSRGYAGLITKLRHLGAQITEIEMETAR